MEELMVTCVVQISSRGHFSGVTPIGFKGRITDMTDQPDENRPTEPNIAIYRYRCDAVNAGLIEADPDCFVLSRVTI